MMNKKSQVLIISLWILILLTMLAIGVGRRVSMALRLSRYQRDSLKAFCLAKAGINRAIAELENDTNKYDSLNETWSTGKDLTGELIFENTELKEGSGETFTVGYRNNGDNYQCMEDEERKININRTDNFGKQQLIELFILKHIDEEEANDLANNIIDWIDDNDIDSTGNKEDRIFKNKPLKVSEELLMILEYFYQIKGEAKFREEAQEVYNKIKDLITVYGESYRVNVNTVSEDVLGILGRAVAKNILPDNILDKKKFGDTVIGEIILLRKKVGFFEEINAINIPFTTGSEEENVLNYLKNQCLSVKSDNFRIESSSNVGKTTKKIIATYNRTNKRIVSWHEN